MGLAVTVLTSACAPAVIHEETAAPGRHIRPGGPSRDLDLPEDESGGRRMSLGRRAALVDIDDAALSDIGQDDDDAQHAPTPTPLTIGPKMVARCRQVRPTIEAAARAGGQDPLLMLAIAWVESGFNPDAESPAGAVGVMQMLPSTARVFGCSDPYESRCAASAATGYFNRLLRKFDGEMVYALCAYHAGHVGPQKAWKAGRLPSNLSYATRVLEARARLERGGCDGR